MTARVRLSSPGQRCAEICDLLTADARPRTVPTCLTSAGERRRRRSPPVEASWRARHGDRAGKAGEGAGRDVEAESEQVPAVLTEPLDELSVAAAGNDVRLVVSIRAAIEADRRLRADDGPLAVPLLTCGQEGHSGTRELFGRGAVEEFQYLVPTRDHLARPFVIRLRRQREQIEGSPPRPPTAGAEGAVGPRKVRLAAFGRADRGAPAPHTAGRQGSASLAPVGWPWRKPVSARAR